VRARVHARSWRIRAGVENACGIGLKMFGVAGPTLLEDKPNSGTFDYALINRPTFFVNTVEHYIFIHELMLFGGAPPPAETPALARAAAGQVVTRLLDTTSAPDVFRPALVDELRERPLRVRHAGAERRAQNANQPRIRQASKHSVTFLRQPRSVAQSRGLVIAQPRPT
jgi:hypothetical protein